MNSESQSAPPVRARAKVTGIVATVVMLVVMLGTVLVVSPAGTPLRAAVRSVALPYFGQTWRVFAPNILKTNRTFEIRAQWRDDGGDLVTSDWVSITGFEQRGTAGNLVPSDIRKNSLNVSGTYLDRYFDLDQAQRDRVRDTFIERAGDGFQPIPVEDLVDDIGEDDADVIRFLRMDYMLMRFGTMYATAGFGEDIERVQWRILRQRPNDFAHRFEAEQQFDTNVTTFGWRQSNIAIGADIIDDYRDVIERFDAVGEFQEAADDAE